MSLTEYNRKRDFKKTAEPAGVGPRKGSGNRFVIQKHAASRLHYDFRLEMDGTLKSWAVPKGVPWIKGEKRLAVQVEDHPVDYIDFEGTIPKGQYGGGTVMVWDRGTYEPVSESPARELAGGKLHFILKGKKLKGEWYLVQLRGSTQWLLIKGGEDQKRISEKLDDTSAKSGKTMEQLAKSNRVWQSNRSEGNEDVPIQKPSPPKKAVKAPIKKKSRVKFRFIEPMKARLVPSAQPGEWIYEIKFDGYRAVAFKNGDEVQLLSRNQKDFQEKFPPVAHSIARLKTDDAVLDGEIVALDPKGRSSFQLLQAYEMNQERPPLFYYVFDLLRLNGEDLTGLPLTERKARLEELVGTKDEVIRFSASLSGEANKLLRQVSELGLEGMIGKKPNSHYEAGLRTGSWIKLKVHQQQEMVIGGYSPPGGSRKYFGALLLGYYENDHLKFAGKVGTGFNDKWLRELSQMFKKIEMDECPFANLPEKRTARYGQSLTLSEMKKCKWVRPKLVCQVKYAEWTRDGKLRQPVFLGLREDKSAGEVVRERPQPV